MNVDANKIIHIMASRNAQNVANLEKEIAFLIAENELLREENELLMKEGKGGEPDEK